MLIEYFRVYVLDKWKMQPLWTRYLYSGFFLLILGVLMPVDGNLLYVAGLSVLAGFGMAGASAVLFLYNLVKKPKYYHTEG